MLESWKHCVARGWTEAAAANAEAKKNTQKTTVQMPGEQESELKTNMEYLPKT